MIKMPIEQKINGPLEIVAYTDRQTIIRLKNRQGRRREYTLKIPISPKNNSLLEEIVNAAEKNREVRFKGTYTEQPTSYFAYILAGLNLFLFISPTSTLEIFKRYSYDGQISISRKKPGYRCEVKTDKYHPGYPRFNIEKITS